MSADVTVKGADSNLKLSVVGPTHGTITISGTHLTYAPEADYSGADTFTLKATDDGASAQATVNIDITAVEDAPVAVDDQFTIDEGGVFSMPTSALLANDSDPDGDTLTVTAVDAATHGTVALAGGNVTFTPTAGFSGAASFTYTVSDGTLESTGDVAIMVTEVNHAPVAVDDATTTVQDTVKTNTFATLIDNDSDPDGDTLTITAVSNATHGTAVILNTEVNFTPTAGFVGTAGYDYTLSDGSLTDTGHVTVTVTAANHAPVAVDDAISVVQDTAKDFPTSTFLGNDTDVDAGTTLTITAFANATHCSVSQAAGTVTVTPEAGFSGAASFDYTVSDGTLTDTGHVVVTVTASNHAPVAVDDAISVIVNTPKDFPASTFLGNDTDADTGTTLSITGFANATSCTVTQTAGTVTVTPATDFVGTASFDYTVSDGTLTDTGHVTITVIAANTPPVATDDAISVLADTAKDFPASTFLSNDVDPDPQTLTITAFANQTHCTVTQTAGVVTVTPEAGFSGAASFDYTVSDGIDTDVGTVAVTVVGNTPPVAVDDAIAVFEDTAKTFPASTFLGNDTDADAGDTLTISGFTNLSHCTVTQAGAIVTVTPEAGFSGAASFDYTVSDGTDTDVGTVTVTVDVPVCGDGVTEGAEQCDDNNTTDHDGCSSTCKIERVCLFTFTGSVGNEATFIADIGSTASGVTNPTMSRGAGIAVSQAANAFAGTSWNTAALDDTAFFEFTLTPDAGVSMTALQLLFGDQRSGTGPTTWSVRSSLDAFAADIDSKPTHPAPLTANTVTLPATFANLAVPVTFRIYAFGASATAGTWRIDNVSVIGFSEGP